MTNMLEYPSFFMYSQIWIEHSVKMEITLCNITPSTKSAGLNIFWHFKFSKW